MAAKVATSREAISSYENKQRIERRRGRIGPEQLAKLAGILDTSTTVLATKLKVRPGP